MARLKEIIESRERCSESGWHAYDFILDEPLTDEEIKGLRLENSSFVYLKSRKKPFFKIESNHIVIKGVSTDSFFRVAIHDDYRELLDTVKEKLKH